MMLSPRPKIILRMRLIKMKALMMRTSCQKTLMRRIISRMMNRVKMKITRMIKSPNKLETTRYRILNNKTLKTVKRIQKLTSRKEKSK